MVQLRVPNRRTAGSFLVDSGLVEGRENNSDFNQSLFRRFLHFYVIYKTAIQTNAY